jgi:hypothetical protein
MNSPLRQREGALRSRAHVRTTAAADAIPIGLCAAIFAVRAEEPVVAAVAASSEGQGGGEALPSGLLSAHDHQSLETGLRFWVYRQTGLELGAAQQLCTVEHRHDGTHAGRPCDPGLALSVCYFALVSPAPSECSRSVNWRSWYAYFPWEDWRAGRPRCLRDDIEPRLKAWASVPEAGSSPARSDRERRLRLCFGCDGAAWDDEKVADRYQLLCEAGVIGDGSETSGDAGISPLRVLKLHHPVLGDQRRVLANAIGALRRAIKCRPALLEIMPERFTLFELQKTVEAILGPHLHKQNFRRLIEGGGLVERTGHYKLRTGGRPAQLYRFRRDMLLDGFGPGVRVKAGRPLS